MKSKRIRQAEEGIEVYCSRCGEWWPDESFVRVGQGYFSWCNACMAEYQKRRRADPIERAKLKTDRQRRYTERRARRLCVQCGQAASGRLCVTHKERANASKCAERARHAALR